MSITNSLDWFLFILALCAAGHLSRKNLEKFRKVMTDTMVYTMGIGIVLCFIQILALFDIKILDTSFYIAWNLSPLEIMSAISALFFCVLAMNSWKKAPASIPYNNDAAK